MLIRRKIRRIKPVVWDWKEKHMKYTSEMNEIHFEEIPFNDFIVTGSIPDNIRVRIFHCVANQ